MNKLTPFRIVCFYILAGGLWILFSDKLLSSLTRNPDKLMLFQTYKGLFFIVFTACLLLSLIRRYSAKQKKTEAALRAAIDQATEEKNKSDAVIAAIGDGISIQDTNFKILYQNQAHKNIIGDHLGEYCYKAYEQRDQACEGCPVALSFRDGGIHTVERSAPIEGGMIHVEITASPLRDSTGRIIAGIEAVRDITEKKKNLEALRAMNERMNAILQTSPEAIVILTPEGIVTLWNKAAEKIFGWTADEVLGKFYPVVPENKLEEFRATVKRMMHGESFSNLEVIRQRKDGSQVAVSFSGAPLRDADGRIVNLIGILSDIADRTKLEAQLRHAQKMEAIGQLTGGIAHDFNNILTAVIGYGSLLLMKMRDDDSLRSNVEEILKAAERAANLTQSLLAFSRKQVISLKAVDLNEIVRRVEKLLLRAMGEDIELKTDLAEEHLTVIADSNQIEQVLINLATNARDAMPDAGMFIIETELVTLDREFLHAHGYGKTGSYALLSVHDTGMGMNEETRQKIFEPFFTTKEVGRGTGLGLSIVYGIIKQHNGYISVYSEIGKGTIFRIYLPIIEAEICEPGLSEPAAERRGTETVLIAEDDETLRKLVSTVLQEFGYTVIIAADGAEAVEKFIANQNRIQLLILDVVMPKKNGRAAYEEIRAIRPDVRVLFTSGYTANIIHKKGVIEEGLNFIHKPVSPNKLLIKVRELLDQ